MRFDRRLTDAEMDLVRTRCFEDGPLAAFDALWFEVITPDAGIELDLFVDTGKAALAYRRYAIPADQLRAIGDLLVCAAESDAELDEVFRRLNFEAPAVFFSQLPVRRPGLSRKERRACRHDRTRRPVSGADCAG